VFIIGFDGMDSMLTEQWMKAGRLPNLARLSREGSFAPLGTLPPVESPTAWASFATGTNPGKHNVYDFVERTPDSYQPRLSLTSVEPGTFLWRLFPIRAAHATARRAGTPFWSIVGSHGLRTRVLTVPLTFPPDQVVNGEVLAGLPVPDVRGTLGLYQFWGSDLSTYEERSGIGTLQRLTFENDVAQATLVGPASPFDRNESITIPLTVRWAPRSRSATITVAGRTLTLQENAWSDWISVAFTLTPFSRIRGITQFCLLDANTELRLYASPVNIDPRDPFVPISQPGTFARDLARTLGPYRTLGWAESAYKALMDGYIGDKQFLDDANRAMDDRERIILRSLDDDDWDLFVAAIETTDRVSHMMWRLTDRNHPLYDAALAAQYGDAIERVYRRADDFVGVLRARVPPDALFIVMSDHGFHSFRRSVNLNTWLLQEGYMALGDEKGSLDSFNSVDWAKTKAYAVGLGQIYLNLRGRERQGLVSSGSESRALQEEMVQKLLALRDEKSGEPVILNVYRGEDIYHGPYLANAPDLVVGFADGYRVGWGDSTGSLTRLVIQDNDRKWSGDHCGAVAALTSGVLFTNRPLRKQNPGIIDLAPTVLQALGLETSAQFDGEALFGGQSR
jgi:predicted AlkP superfamily phosphohydrolase/phosphomutase